MTNLSKPLHGRADDPAVRSEIADVLKVLAVGHDVSDKKSLKEVAMTEVHIVEEIPRRWDPIGVMPNVDGGPLNEYDSYAPHIVSIVKAAAPTEILAAHQNTLLQSLWV